MKFFKFIDSLMPVISTLLVVLIVTMLLTQFNQLPRIFLVMAGVIIGMEITKRMDARLIKMQDELIEGYSSLFKTVREAIDEAEKESKIVAEEAQKRADRKNAPKVGKN